MKKEILELTEGLVRGERLNVSEYRRLIDERDEELSLYLASLAREAAKEHYGNRIFIRGLIEVSNICKNDCLYCGIRRSNEKCERYRLSEKEILECCREGYALGFRTFVLQGGEDGFFGDEFLVRLIGKIKNEHPDSAITLSLGERSRESYERLRAAGADRYLLRHETANREHYERLHPSSMSYDNRMRCLYDLRELGFQVGCGFMVGSPYQTSRELSEDLKFIEEFSPDMCGIGPFIPQRDTPFSKEARGSLELTCYLLSIIRLIKPTVLLPATTALGTIHPSGRKMGVLSGANVVMPNLSPKSARERYTLYDGKASISETVEYKTALEKEMASIGYEVVTDRGDVKKL